MIRVLHVVGCMDYGGTEKRLLEYAQNVDARRFHFDFCTLTDKIGAYDNEIKKLGFEIIPSPLTKNIFAFARRFRALLKRGRYDVLHCHVYQFSGLPLRIAARCGIPKRLIHVHTARELRRNGSYRKWYYALTMHWIRRYATRIIAVSESAMTSFMGDHWQKECRAEIIHDALDVQPYLIHYDRSETLADLGIHPDKKIVIHVGNFGPPKDHETIIRTATLLVRQNPEIHFILVGDGPLMQPINNLVRKNNIENNVHLLGRRNDVPRLLQAADCFFFPSRWEGLPGALLEALAAGLTAVASDIGPNQEVANVTVNNRILMSPVGQAERFARQLQIILTDPSKHKYPLGWIPDEFRLEKFMERIGSLYEE